MARRRSAMLPPFPSTPRFEQLLGDGARWGLNLQYAVQTEPGRHPAQALLIGEHFVGKEPCALVLGDNIYSRSRSRERLAEGRKKTFRRHGVRLPSQDPQRYGVIEFGRTVAR